MAHVAIVEPLGVDEQLVRDLMNEIPGITYEYFTTRSVDQDELTHRARGADVIVVANTPLSKKALASSPTLRMVSVAFTGLDHIDLAFCQSHGIEVINCSGYSTNAVAEEVFGLALMLCRHLNECDHRVRTGADKSGLSVTELYNKTLGVVGNGAIAQRVMQIARAFGMNLLCWARNPRPLEGVTYVSLEELCAHSDVLTLHVPAVPETHHLIDARLFSLMKPTAVLINTARGPIVDTDALVTALEQGTIAGAGLDVFDAEPPLDPSLPILHAPHTVLAPHIGFATEEALDARARMAIDHVRTFLAQ